MNDQPLMNEATAKRLNAFTDRPRQGLLLTGQRGVGKRYLAEYIAAKLLAVDKTKISEQPYLRVVSSGSSTTIGIDSIRALDEFIRLKVPGKKQIDRVIVIDSAERMSIEAQNALLKLLEEPPEGTIIVLTTENTQSLLPTIISRVQRVAIAAPEIEQVSEHFQQIGFDAAKVKQAIAISGGLPGLTYAILTDDEGRLLTAADTAKNLLSGSSFDRVRLIEQLARDKTLSADVLFMMQQMSRYGLRGSEGRAATKWLNIMKHGFQAEQALQANASPKLVLTDMMLKL